MNLMKYFFISLFVSVVLWTCKSSITDENQPVAEKKKCNVLFVGNSYTFYNDGVDSVSYTHLTLPTKRIV